MLHRTSRAASAPGLLLPVPFLLAPLVLSVSMAACGGGPAKSPPPPLPGAPPGAASTELPGGSIAPPPQTTQGEAPSPVSLAHVPAGLPIGVSPTLYAISVAPEKVPTPEMVALGEKLFDDKRLSADGTIACSTCHDPKRGFVDHKATSEGIGKQKGQRNSPTVLNAMFNATQFWDGRSANLEEQAKLPILNPIEMGQKTPEDVVTKVKAVPEYAAAFQKVFQRDVTYDDLAAAIAAFERTQYSGEAPFDRYIQGDENALDASAKRGWALFNGKARCNSCHAGNAVSPLFSDQKFHNIGVAAQKQDFVGLAREAVSVVNSGNAKQIDELALQSKFSELGRYLVTKSTNDVGAFKTPTLRNIAVTAPYMHDGSFATLWDVVDHYNKGGIGNPYLDGGIQRLGLTEPQVDDLVHFLGALTADRYAAYGKSELAAQEARKGTRPQRDTAVALGQKGDTGDVGVDPDKAKSPSTDGTFGTYDVKGARNGK